MNLIYSREHYLTELVSRENNGLIKVITGIRRVGKSYLLNNIFYNYLINEKKINPNNIIRFAFDNLEDIALLDDYLKDQATTIKKGKLSLVNGRKFLSYINDKCKEKETYYLLLDEIQNLEDFVRVLNSFLYKGNFDVYVTGSNSKFLSSEVDTEFGGRGDRIHILPLTFKEYLAESSLEKRDALDEYIRYGGVPLIASQDTEQNKINIATSIVTEAYIKDLLLRHPRINRRSLDDTLKTISSMISTPINPNKIANTFKSVYKTNVPNGSMINDYINWFSEAYLLNKIFRYDIKGRKYIGTPYKIYFEDVGIRNAILNFKEIDQTDLIENIAYNELRFRGFNVDVGVVKIKEKTNKLDKNNKPIYVEKEIEVDFVASKNNKIYYIQVIQEISDDKKKEQEYKPIRNIPDSFKKVIIVKNEGKHYYTNEGFLRISLLDFLNNLDSLDW